MHYDLSIRSWRRLSLLYSKYLREQVDVTIAMGCRLLLMGVSVPESN